MSLLALLITATTVTNPSRATDICLAMVPPRLAEQILREQPNYALALLTDVPAPRVLQTADSGGWPCPFVAAADVDGDGTLDRAVILKHKTEPGVRLLVARQLEKGWRIELQREWPIALAAALVEPLDAGFYEQSPANRDSAKNLDEQLSIQSEHAGFVAGQTDGRKAALFFQNGAWRQLWLSE
jgi:hypothetical protein